MVVQAGTGIYHVSAANVNRIVRFQFDSAVTNAFLFLRGNNAFYPFTSQTGFNPGTAATANQLIAQQRVSALVRGVTLYAIPVAVSLATVGGHANSAVIISFETSESNVFPSVNDIADTLGLAGQAAKTKSGLQTLATGVVANATLDGGSTLLFAVNPNLSDGTASTAPAIAAITVTAL